ncbi:unnamed protein product, partial [Rotaria magnacalcarata]
MTEEALSSLRSPSSSSIPSTSVTLPASITTTSKDSLSSTTMVQTKSSVEISNSINDTDRLYCYLTTEAKINDIPGIVLLDTGSGVTIISSSHWKIINSGGPIAPYNGPEIQGPDGSSIGPEGRVVVQITLAGSTTHHPAVLARNFHHLILLGNDFMKS